MTIFKPTILLPEPFDWCYIPAGDITLTLDAPSDDVYIRDDKLVNVPEFWMAKYPITNAQYQQFMDDGGYRNDVWWTQVGRNWRDDIQKPYSWDDALWNGGDYPVVGVSWHEAIAFCNWLSHKMDAKILLPNDAQWQRAVQGDNHTTYVWGNEWNDELCNHGVDGKGIGHTTPIRQYEGKSDSPFGVVDMVGNVWEWCLTGYHTGLDNLDSDDIRILRGGSWAIFGAHWFRSTFRSAYYPDGRRNYVGFRLVYI